MVERRRGRERLIAIKTTASAREIQRALGSLAEGVEQVARPNVIIKAPKGGGGAAAWGVTCGGFGKMGGMKGLR